jgi:hypothetical protein
MMKHLNPPTKCDICRHPIGRKFFDAQLNGRSGAQGSWACICPECFKHFGVGLGVGRGQEYFGSPTTGYSKARG